MHATHYLRTFHKNIAFFAFLWYKYVKRRVVLTLCFVKIAHLT